jgi:hypothetical protein
MHSVASASDGKAPYLGPRDLKEDILKWYGGYNWGGEERVLNPYYIFNLFDIMPMATIGSKGLPRPFDLIHKTKVLEFS